MSDYFEDEKKRYPDSDRDPEQQPQTVVAPFSTEYDFWDEHGNNIPLPFSVKPAGEEEFFEIDLPVVTLYTRDHIEHRFITDRIPTGTKEIRFRLRFEGIDVDFRQCDPKQRLLNAAIRSYDKDGNLIDERSYTPPDKELED